MSKEIEVFVSSPTSVEDGLSKEKRTVPNEDEVIPAAMWRAALLVAIQSFLYGYVFSCFNSSLLTGDNNSGSDCFHGTDSSCPDGTVYNDLNLTTVEASLATGLAIIGGYIGCMCASYPSELYGRKPTLLWNNLFFIVGAALCCNGNMIALFIGRFLSGVGVGIESVVVPTLLSEIASPRTKGVITTMTQAAITLGIFLTSILGYGFVVYVEHGWQYMQAWSAIPALVMLAFHSYVPESPKWLLATMRSGEAATHEEVTALLTSLRLPSHDVAGEIADMVREAKGDADNKEEVTWTELFANKQAVVIGCGLLFFQAMTGINSVTFYSTTIFGLAGFTPPIAGTVLWTFINFAITLVSAYLVDKVGRKVLLTGGTYLMLGSLVALSVVLISDMDSAVQGGLCVLFVLLYVIGFAIGLGAVVWVIMSEIMSTRLRVKATSMFLSINWVFNILISFLTLTAINSLGGQESGQSDDEIEANQKQGVAYLYFIFAGLTLLCLAFIHLCVPETKKE